MSLILDSANYDACPRYNDWLDDQYSDQSGSLNILGFQPRPSFVLFKLSPDTYEATFSDFNRLREDEIKDIVFDSFPSPIAYYFYRFQNGYENELQRLHFLRDTWESTIDVLHALALAECRHRQVALNEPIKFKNFFSDSVAQRLENIEEIIAQISATGVLPNISQISSTATLAVMRDLNQSRNAFSHSAAQSEMQARNWISECLFDVLEILAALEGMKDVQIVRYLNQNDRETLRCETFKGQSSTRTIQNINLTPQQIAESSQYFRPGQILVISNGMIFGLRPMIHFREDSVGHTTRLCMFRKTRGEAPNRRLEYEVVGEAVRYEENRILFAVEVTELRALFGLGAD